MRTVNIGGSHIGSTSFQLQIVRKVLEEWLRLMEDKHWGQDDAPWWYNERASLSLFAGAVWNCGGWVFEEYTTNKGSKSKRSKKRRYGRGDIYFQIGRQKFIAEAKQCWPASGKRAVARHTGGTETLKQTLEDARKDARDLPRERGGRRMGLVFASPRLPLSDKAILNELVQGLKEELPNLKGTTLAWTFPARCRNLKGKDGYYYPGTILLMKPISFKAGERSLRMRFT
jgi:hypothetical protein